MDNVKEILVFTVYGIWIIALAIEHKIEGKKK